MKSSTRHMLFLGAAVTSAYLAQPASASYTELASRGLPSSLAVDESNFTMFPASATEISQRVQIQVSSGEASDKNRTGFGMIGTKRRVAYMTSGSLQYLLLAVPSGWGVAFGYENNSDRNNSEDRQELGDLSREARSEEKSDSRRMRAALGWKSRNSNGRLFEVGLRGDSYRSGSERTSSNGTESFTTDSELRSRTIETIVRTLTDETGLMASASFRYTKHRREDADPVHNSSSDGYLIGTGASLAYRYRVSGVDDVVAGLSCSFSRHTTSTRRDWKESSFQNQDVESDGTRGTLFVSVERQLRQNLFLRAGASTNVRHFRFESDESFESSQRNTESSREGSRWTAEKAVVALGFGWASGSFTLDGNLKTNIEFERPLLNWSATFEFD